MTPLSCENLLAVEPDGIGTIDATGLPHLFIPKSQFTKFDDDTKSIILENNLPIIESAAIAAIRRVHLLCTLYPDFSFSKILSTALEPSPNDDTNILPFMP